MFVEVILPLPLRQLFTYELPVGNVGPVRPGMRVVVPFGKRKLYTGMVYSVFDERPHFATKEILTVLDDEPLVDELHIRFWEWTANYYMCTLGEVFRAALPAGLKPEGETVISLNSISDTEELSPKEQQIVNALSEEKDLSLSKLKQKLDFKGLYTLNKLRDRQIISFKEKIKEKYKPKTEVFITLAESVSGGLNEAQKQMVEKAPKQRQALEFITDRSNPSDWLYYEDKAYIKRNVLMTKAGVSAAVLKGLVKKGFLEEYEQEIDRLKPDERTLVDVKALSPAQEKTYNDIKEAFTKKDIVLLHGQTSSGKTELYIRLAEEVMQAGRQVLYLLPEIALSAQITERLKNHFGDKVGVFHSRYSDAERTEIWRHISPAGPASKYQMILGVRSSVFLPFDNLGLIIVDEEHEASYKQYQPAPRYNAANLSTVLGLMHGAKLLLGSATPSVESYFNAYSGKYALAELNERYGKVSLPEIIVADIKEAQRKKQMKSRFTKQLYNAVSDALSNREQVILFQNRRGFAPFLICNECAWVPRCKHCDVSLVYHKKNDRLVCHYCGYSEDYPHVCDACKQPAVKPAGFGTEQIEQSVEELFPSARILRMDLDTTAGKNAYEQIISAFENHEADILIGTQMVSKGLDFENVTVVGIMQADLMLNYPDFRANERAFQTMMQVSGRAGRRGKRGKVIIQTGNAEHVVIQSVIDNDYKGMFREQTAERKLFKYPPFYRTIILTVKFRDLSILDKAAELLATELRKYLKDPVLGPEYPPVAKIKNWYMKNILIKIDRQKSVHRAKHIIEKVTQSVNARQAFRYVQFVYDVDPV